MSFLLLLDDSKLESIVNLLPKYEKMIEDAEPIFKLEGRRLEEIARTLPHYQSSYDQSYKEMGALEEWIKNIKDKKVAKLWKNYNENNRKALSTKDIQTYIAGEPPIVELNQILIEVTLIKDQLFSIVDALKQMGWMIGNMTKLRIAEMQDAIL